MADHADGIYQYTSVNVRDGVTVTFKPNGKNTPVVNTGTLSSSTATVLMNMPRGGGIIYATAATGN